MTVRFAAKVFAFPLAIALALAGAAPVRAEAPVGLGAATSFAVLAGTTVTNTGSSVVSGDVGVSPGSAIDGFPPGVVNNGVIHATDAVAAQAQLDLTVAYDDASGRTPVTPTGPDLAGLTLVTGVYSAGEMSLTGTLTLDAQNDPNAAFVFHAASSLITGSASVVSLINGANACNVFWQVGSSATLGTGSAFVGTIMALTSIEATTGATVQGRLLARNGAVTLDANVITAPVGCPAVAVPATTTTVAATTTVSPTTQSPTTAVSPTTTFSPTGETLPETGSRSTTTALPASMLLVVGGVSVLLVRRSQRPGGSRPDQ